MSRGKHQKGYDSRAISKPVGWGLSLFFALLLLTACTWYGEVEHISSVRNGTPFNDREETSADVIWTGIRAERDGWYVDGAIGKDVSSELQGRDPYARFIVGKEFKTWGNDSD